METEITSTEPLNITVNDSDTRSRESNQLYYTGDKPCSLNNTETSQNKASTNRKKTLIIRGSVVKNIERWIFNKKLKSFVAVKLIPGATAKTLSIMSNDVQRTTLLIQSYFALEPTISNKRNP